MCAKAGISRLLNALNDFSCGMITASALMKKGLHRLSAETFRSGERKGRNVISTRASEPDADLRYRRNEGRSACYVFCESGWYHGHARPCKEGIFICPERRLNCYEK